MTIQYNVPVKVLNPDMEYMIQTSLQPYKVFTDEYGNLDKTCFSREELPYIGEIVVVKTLKKDAAEKAHQVLSGIEGLLVFPINESTWERNRPILLTRRR